MSKLIQAELAKCVGNFFSHASGSNVKTDTNLVQGGNSKQHMFDGHYAFSVMPNMDNTEWIIDSGASSHICSNPKLMCTTYQLVRPTIIYLPDGTYKAVAYAGKMKLTKDIFLVDVLFVPGFTHNLLSVAQLIQELDVKCTFYPTHCIFQKQETDQLMGVGKMKNNLYIIESITEKFCCNLLNPNSMTVQEWHAYLRHPSISTMKHMDIVGRKYNDEELRTLENYEVCLKAKQCRDQFPILHRRSTALFEMVHGDVWGRNQSI